MSTENPAPLPEIYRDEEIQTLLRTYSIQTTLTDIFESNRSGMAGSRNYIPVAEKSPKTPDRQLFENRNQLLLTTVADLRSVRPEESVNARERLLLLSDKTYPFIAVLVHPDINNTAERMLVSEITTRERNVLRAFGGNLELNITASLSSEAEAANRENPKQAVSHERLLQIEQQTVRIYQNWLERLQAQGYPVTIDDHIINTYGDTVIRLPFVAQQSTSEREQVMTRQITERVRKLIGSKQTEPLSFSIPEKLTYHELESRIVILSEEIYRNFVDQRQYELLQGAVYKKLGLFLDSPIERQIADGILRNGIGVDGITMSSVIDFTSRPVKKRLIRANSTVRKLGFEYRIIRGTGIALVPINYDGEQSREYAAATLLHEWGEALLHNGFLEEIPESVTITEDVYLSKITLRKGLSEDLLPGVEGKKLFPFYIRLKNPDQTGKFQSVVFLGGQEAQVFSLLLEHKGYFESGLTNLDPSRVSGAISGIIDKFSATNLLSDQQPIMVRETVREFFTLFGDYTRRSDFLLKAIDAEKNQHQLTHIEGRVGEFFIELIDGDQFSNESLLSFKGVRGRHAGPRQSFAVFTFVNNQGESQRVAIDVAPGLERSVFLAFVTKQSTTVTNEEITQWSIGTNYPERAYIKRSLDHIAELLEANHVPLKPDVARVGFNESGTRISTFSFPELNRS